MNDEKDDHILILGTETSLSVTFPFPHNCADQCQLCDAYRHGRNTAMLQIYYVLEDWKKKREIQDGERMLLEEFMEDAAQRAGMKVTLGKRAITAEDELLMMESEGRIQ